MAQRWSARPARSSRRPCASSPRAIRTFSSEANAVPDLLFRRLLQRRNARQDDLDSRSAARLGIKLKPAAQTVGHDAVDDMQTEPGATLVAARREKRIERATPDIETHAAAIVGEDNLDIVLAGFP